MARRFTVKNPYYENLLFFNRSVAALTFIAILTVVLLARLVYLQVVEHQHYTTLSRENRLKIVALPPTRGLIYDRNGVLLAENLPSYRLEITPDQVHNLNATLRRLGEIIDLRASDLKRFDTLLKNSRPFESIPLRYHLSQDEVARFAVNRWRFPGVDIAARLTRYYPLGRLTAHVVGYVGRIDERELQEVDPSEYSATTHIGKIGVEKAYESMLHGKVGYEQVEVNAQGRVVRVMGETPPVPGRNLYLTLDAGLQQVAEQGLAGYSGAAVALDPRTGAVLALVSKPSFDPNLFVNGISSAQYQALANDPDRPLFDRALRGRYPPGSTLKPFVAVAGLNYGIINPATTYYCPGYYTLPGNSHKYRCWKTAGHGIVDLDKAITQSCDVYFYNLSHALGIDRLDAFLSKFGFGAKTGIDLPGELAGLLPSRAWKRRMRHEPWYPGDTLITGIGQGYMLATPLQLANATAALSMHGRRMEPRVVYAIQNPRNGTLHIEKPKPLTPITLSDPGGWSHVITDMTHVVTSIHGTAHRIDQGAPYVIAGKTGTAQVFGLKQDQNYNEKDIPLKLRDQALFIAFAPADNPRIAVAVIAEHAGFGGEVSAPIARKMMDYYLLSNDNEHTVDKKPQPGR